MLNWVLFCIIRFHIKENRVLLFPVGARPHPVSVTDDARCYFDVRPKADMSQLNLPHGKRAEVYNRDIL